MDEMTGMLQDSAKWNTAVWMESGGKIADDSGNIVTPTCNEFQREVSDIIEWCHEHERPARIIILKPRRKGSSTVSVAAGYRRLQAQRATGCVAGGSHYQGGKLFDMLKIYADNDAINPKSCKVLDMEARFNNGSSMDRLTLANAAAGRSGGYQFLVVTEMALLSAEGVANAPAVVSGLLKTVKFLPDTIVILESTASGATGDYFERYQTAITFEEFKAGRNGFVKVFYPWFAFTDSRTDPAGEGIESDADLTDKELELADKHGLDLAQIAWMRMTLRDDCRGDFDKFQEDYPFDDDSAFLKSGRGRFGNEGLAYQDKVVKITTPEFGILEHDLRSDRVMFRPTSESEARVVRFEQPRVGCSYIQATDPATGDSQTSGLDPDSNSYGVLRKGYLMNGRWIEPAVVMRNICYPDGTRFGNWWDTDIVEEEIYRMARYYGGCKIAVEVNKDRGFIELLKLRTDVDLYQREMFNRREQVTTNAYGWNTDVRTREMLISTLARALREAGRGKVNEGIELRCPWLVTQMKNFVTKANGRSEAASGKHDDDVLMVAIGLQLLDHATPYCEEDREAWVPRDLRESPNRRKGGGQWS